jgi:tetratricopeptide (TPR) repeat protein
MKKLILMVAAVVVCSVAGAQVFKLDQGLMLKEIEKSDQNIAHAKRSLRADTWMQRGDAMFNAMGFMLTKTYPGQPVKDMLTTLGKVEPTTVEAEGQAYQVYSYPYADIYTVSDVVQFWTMKVVVYEGAAEKAVEAYKKVAELDPAMAIKAAQGILHVGDVLSVEANALNALGKQEPAAEVFWKSFNIKREPLLGKIDSVSAFNAGYIFMMNKKYDRATEIFETAIENNVWEEGRTPYFLSWVYMQTNQLDKAKAVLDKALLLFPDNQDLLASIVDYYTVTGGDFNEIKTTLEKALEADPDNVSVWNGLGQIYLKDTDLDKAIEFFGRYVAKFPDSAQANFYLGHVWYKKGNELLTAADKEKTMSRTAKAAALEAAKDAYRQAWKYLNISYGQKPDEAITIEHLTFVTYRIIEDPGMEAFYNKIEAEYKALED